MSQPCRRCGSNSSDKTRATDRSRSTSGCASELARGRVAGCREHRTRASSSNRSIALLALISRQIGPSMSLLLLQLARVSPPREAPNLNKNRIHFLSLSTSAGPSPSPRLQWPNSRIESSTTPSGLPETTVGVSSGAICPPLSPTTSQLICTLAQCQLEPSNDFSVFKLNETGKLGQCRLSLPALERAPPKKPSSNKTRARAYT